MPLHSQKCSYTKIHLCREALHDMMGMIKLQADGVQLSVEVGDDTMALYCMQRLITIVKAAAKTGNDLRDNGIEVQVERVGSNKEEPAL